MHLRLQTSTDSASTWLQATSFHYQSVASTHQVLRILLQEPLMWASQRMMHVLKVTQATCSRRLQGTVLSGCVESTRTYISTENFNPGVTAERIFVWICSKMFEIVSLEKAQFCCHHCFAMLLQLSPIQLRSTYNDLIHSKKYGETTTCGSRCLQFACFASGITKQKSSVGQGHHHRWGLPSFEHLQFDVCRMATDAYSLTQS